MTWRDWKYARFNGTANVGREYQYTAHPHDLSEIGEAARILREGIEFWIYTHPTLTGMPKLLPYEVTGHIGNGV